MVLGIPMGMGRTVIATITESTAKRSLIGLVPTMSAAATASESPTRPGISSSVLGMAFFVAVEVLFFAGMLSAYFVTRADMAWPPEGQPRLPVWATLFNTLLLFISGFLFYRAGKLKRLRWEGHEAFKKSFILSMVLGGLFLVLQGKEWIDLIQHGLTLQSSLYGSSFYVIVGTHGVHALASLVFSGFLLAKVLAKQEVLDEHFDAAQLFWYFVVGIWPLIYIFLYIL